MTLDTLQPPCYSALVAEYRRTRYRHVRWRGRILYYKVRTRLDDDHGRPVWREMRYGEGTPHDAERARKEAQAREDQMRAGIRSAQDDAHDAARRPLETVLDEYEKEMHRRCRDSGHAKTVLRYIRRCAQHAGWQALADVDAPSVERWLTEMFAGKSTHHPLTAVRGFCNWAVKTGRMGKNPLGDVKRRRESNASRQSVALTRDEYEAILRVATPERRALYLLCGTSGLRHREAGRLRWGQIDMASGWAHLLSGETKSGQPERVPLTERTMEALTDIMPDHPSADAEIFPTTVSPKTWKRDLERAGIPYRVPGGQHDMKCLRLSYCTWLYQSGVDLRAAQRLMRHSDPGLTARIYTQISEEELRHSQGDAFPPPNPAEIARVTNGSPRDRLETVKSEQKGRVNSAKGLAPDGSQVYNGGGLKNRAGRSAAW